MFRWFKSFDTQIDEIKQLRAELQDAIADRRIRLQLELDEASRVERRAGSEL